MAHGGALPEWVFVLNTQSWHSVASQVWPSAPHGSPEGQELLQAPPLHTFSGLRHFLPGYCKGPLGRAESFGFNM